jgi:hypothetical protein
VGVVLLIATAVALLAVIYAALQIQSGVRAYVGGEGLYSKGQKDAVFHLLRYADTRNEPEYQAYLADIAAPRGDKTARLELEKPSPDLNVAAAGFAQGRNNDADIPILITTFRLFRHVSYRRGPCGELTDAAAEGQTRLLAASSASGPQAG